MAEAEAPELGMAARLVAGAAAGLAGGLVASFVMDQFQALTSPEQEGEPANEQAADAAVKAATGTTLPKETKPAGGQAVHYGLGAALGLGYGLTAEFMPEIRAGAGTLFGTGTWALLDEAAVPAMGWGDPPWEAPLSSQAYGLASHLVFGLALELTRTLTRKAIARAGLEGA